MRILQSYRFPVGTKIPFEKLPAIIEEYLQKQNLQHHSFHYYLESYADSERDGEDARRKQTGCERALKENPFLGTLHISRTKHITIQSLCNFSEESNQSKGRIYQILPKIYRRYGFVQTGLIYRDIDFFSRRVQTPAPEPEYLINGYEGSGITLYRSCISSDNGVILAVESSYPGDVPDATPYADALGELLPGIKRVSATKVIMNDEEENRYKRINAQAEPLVARANALFQQQMPEEKGNNEPESEAKVATLLKKLGKQYGYTYCGYGYYIYRMEKRLSNGHYICLDFISNPLNPDAEPFVSLCGLGFKQDIWADGFSPQNPRDASDYFKKLFDTLSEAEKTVFPDILELYPPTPDWFVPTHF